MGEECTCLTYATLRESVCLKEVSASLHWPDVEALASIPSPCSESVDARAATPAFGSLIYRHTEHCLTRACTQTVAAARPSVRQPTAQNSTRRRLFCSYACGHQPVLSATLSRRHTLGERHMLRVVVWNDISSGSPMGSCTWLCTIFSSCWHHCQSFCSRQKVGGCGAVTSMATTPS